MRAQAWSFLVLAALLAGSVGCRKNNEVLPERTVRVVTAKLKPHLFVQKYTVQANVEAAQCAVLSSQSAGNVEALAVDTGGAVVAGQVLAVVDRENLANDVVMQRARLAVAQTAFDTAKITTQMVKLLNEKSRKDLERYQKLHKDKIVSDDAMEKKQVLWDESELSLQQTLAKEASAQAQLRQAEANLRIAQKKLDNAAVKAPFAGVIIDRKVDLGAYVNPGTKMFEIADLTTLELRSRIISAYFNYLQPGVTKVKIYDMDKKFLGDGVISFKGPAVDALSRTFELRCKVPQDTALALGMLGELEIILQQKPGFAIPADALVGRQNGDKVVFVVENGRAIAKKVEPGIVDGDWCDLINAAALGDADVVVQGQVFLQDGDKVELVDLVGNSAKVEK